MIKIDSNGFVIWSESYGDTAGSAVCEVVQETPDKGYLIIGRTSDFGLSNSGIYLINLDSATNAVWSKTYDEIDLDYAGSGMQTPDRGYIIVGNTFSFGGVQGDVFFIKTDSLGNTIFVKVYDTGIYDQGYSVYPVSDGGYVLSGATYYNVFPNVNIYLIKTDSSGCNEKDVTMTVGNPATTVTIAATLVSSAPFTVSTPSTIETYAFTTTDTLCFSGIGYEDGSKIDPEIKIFPNPSYNYFTIQIISGALRNRLHTRNSVFVLYDLLGRKAKQIKMNENIVQVNRNELSDGMYIFKLSDEERIISTGKIIIQ